MPHKHRRRRTPQALVREEVRRVRRFSRRHPLFDKRAWLHGAANGEA
ncbi:hypothetical protein [Terrarubrum flagellatum]